MAEEPRRVVVIVVQYLVEDIDKRQVGALAFPAMGLESLTPAPPACLASLPSNPTSLRESLTPEDNYVAVSWASRWLRAAIFSLNRVSRS